MLNYRMQIYNDNNCFVFLYFSIFVYNKMAQKTIYLLLCIYSHKLCTTVKPHSLIQKVYNHLYITCSKRFRYSMCNPLFNTSVSSVLAIIIASSLFIINRWFNCCEVSEVAMELVTPVKYKQLVKFSLRICIDNMPIIKC